MSLVLGVSSEMEIISIGASNGMGLANDAGDACRRALVRKGLTQVAFPVELLAKLEQVRRWTSKGGWLGFGLQDARSSRVIHAKPAHPTT